MRSSWFLPVSLGLAVLFLGWGPGCGRAPRTSRPAAPAAADAIGSAAPHAGDGVGPAAIAQTQIQAQEISYDHSVGTLSYRLAEPALVRIRIGIGNGGPLIRTLVDWEPREAGPQIEVWDRRDMSGDVSYENQSDVLVVIACLPLDTSGYDKYASSIQGLGRSPDFEILFPETLGCTDAGLPVISGIAPVRVVLGDADRQRLTNTQYEVVIFLDNIFLIEEEEGTNPYTYFLNTRGINEGAHTITVNVISYEGEVGTRGRKCFVRKD